MTLHKRSVTDGIGDVLPPNPRSATPASLVTSAREAYLRGDFPQCVAALEGRNLDDPKLRTEALFLLARALLRLQRSSEVVELLGPVLSIFSTVDEMCTARMLHGTAVARAQDADSGLALLASAAKIAESQRADRAICAELAYYRGLAHWTKCEYQEASRFAKSAERAKADVLSVRAMQLRAFTALATAKFDDALKLFERARQAYAQCRGRDLDLATQIILQIASLEMNLRSASTPGSHTQPNSRAIPGTVFGPSINTSTRMQMLIADAWLFALDGNRISAFRRAYDAIRIAPTQAWRVWALTTAAAVCQAFGEVGGARTYADDATQLAQSVDWNVTAAEERIGLLPLTEVLALVNAGEAPAMLQRYDAVTSEIDPTRVLRDRDGDPRLVGWDAYVRGLVARALGDHDRAAERFRAAAEQLHACGYLWRSALALIELDATPTDSRGEVPLEKAAIIIRDNFPRSFLAMRLGSWGRAFVDPVASALTPAQRDVLRRLIEGKSVTAISLETNRSRRTVQKHIEALHAAFGTHSFGELFAACARRGIGGPGLAPHAAPEALPRIS